MLNVLLYADLLVSRAKKRAMLFHVFFRINVAIVVRTDFSSVFINQTSLSLELKRLELRQLFATVHSRTYCGGSPSETDCLSCLTWSLQVFVDCTPVV